MKIFLKEYLSCLTKLFSNIGEFKKFVLLFNVSRNRKKSSLSFGKQFKLYKDTRHASVIVL